MIRTLCCPLHRHGAPIPQPSHTRHDASPQGLDIADGTHRVTHALPPTHPPCPASRSCTCQSRARSRSPARGHPPPCQHPRCASTCGGGASGPGVSPPPLLGQDHSVRGGPLIVHPPCAHTSGGGAQSHRRPCCHSHSSGSLECVEKNGAPMCAHRSGTREANRAGAQGGAAATVQAHRTDDRTPVCELRRRRPWCQ